jgi:hypothetical protein
MALLAIESSERRRTLLTTDVAFAATAEWQGAKGLPYGSKRGSS